MQRAAGTERSMLSARNYFGLAFYRRGISKDLSFFYGVPAGEGETEWRNFLTGEKAREAPEYMYLVHDEKSLLSREFFGNKNILSTLGSRAYSIQDLARVLSRFTEILYSLKTTGQSGLLNKIGLGNLKEVEDLELVSLHESSARIEIAALKHATHLIRRGCNPYLAQAYAAGLVIDQVSYGQYRDKKLKTSTVYELCVKIAKTLHLFGEDTQFNTKLVTEKLFGA